MDKPRIETRISLVLYGGVSLAVYMSGACKELLSVVRAGSEQVPDEDLSPVEREYRRICQSGGTDRQPRRVVVDVLSGSSAGGLNALFLAKALAHGGNLDGLRKVWYEEAGLHELMAGIDKGRMAEPPKALLDGPKFHEILYDALSDLSDQAKRIDPDSEDGRLVDAVDCFVTTTDLRGVAETVRLDTEGTMEIQELRRRAVFHFVDRRPSQNRPRETQLDDGHDAVLAFAGRATSAHPAALYPANWHQVEAGRDRRSNRDHDLKRFLSPRLHPEEGYLDLENRWYTDGGAMDNKPFKYAMAPVRNRRAEIPVDRKVLFVEPDPVAELDQWQDTAPPNLLSYTVGTYGLARSEDIREDIAELAAKNDAVARLNSALNGLFQRSEAEIRAALLDRLDPAYPDRDRLTARRLAEAVLDAGYSRFAPDSTAIDGVVGTWINQSREEFGAARGWGAVAQEDYRWRTVVSQLVRTALSVGETPADPALVARLSAPVKERIEAWIEQRNGDVPNIQRVGLALLDVDYRLRRFTLIEHLLSKIQRTVIDKPSPTPEDFRHFDQCVKLRRTVNTLYFDLSDYVDRQRKLDLVGGHRRLSDQELLEYLESEDFDRRIEQTVEELSYPLGRSSDDGREAILTADLDDQLLLRAADAWVNYGDYDQLILPLEDAANSKFETVDAVRVSPLDARMLVDECCPIAGRRKLGGNALAHFGGFLDENWRLNDITWGRLDTAEVVVTRILKGSADDVRRVQRALLIELATEIEDGAVDDSPAGPGGPAGNGGSANPAGNGGSAGNGGDDRPAPRLTTGPGAGTPLDALLAVNGNRDTAVHRRAETVLANLRSGHGSAEDVADAFFELFHGPARDAPIGEPPACEPSRAASASVPKPTPEALWTVDLTATEHRRKAKKVALNQGAILAGKALAFSEIPQKPSRVVIGWLLSGSLRLTLPRTIREKIVRHGLPVLLALAALPVLYMAVGRQPVAAGFAALTLVALGTSLYFRARAFGTNRVPRLWHNIGRVTGVASVLSLAASIVIGPGAAGLTLIALCLLLIAVVMRWSFGNLEALIQRAGHPVPDQPAEPPAVAEPAHDSGRVGAMVGRPAPG